MIGQRLLMAGSLCALPLFAEQLSVPLDGGKLVLQNVRFIARGADQQVPELYFKIDNHTSSAWWEVVLRFSITATCREQTRKWVVPASTSLGYSEDHIVGNVFRETYEPLDAEVQGCQTDAIAVELDYALNGTRRVVGTQRAKQEAAEAALQRRLAAQRSRREAEQEARAAERRRKVRGDCAATYRTTANKRIADLTVQEEQQVRTCQALGLYPPK